MQIEETCSNYITDQSVHVCMFQQKKHHRHHHHHHQQQQEQQQQQHYHHYCHHSTLGFTGMPPLFLAARYVAVAPLIAPHAVCPSTSTIFVLRAPRQNLTFENEESEGCFYKMGKLQYWNQHGFPQTVVISPTKPSLLLGRAF